MIKIKWATLSSASILQLQFAMLRKSDDLVHQFELIAASTENDRLY